METSMEMLHYGDLAAAIIEQAVYDYEAQLRKYYKMEDDDKTLKHIKNLENFFQSKWFDTLAGLCNLNIGGNIIIRTVKDRIRTKYINQVS